MSLPSTQNEVMALMAEMGDVECRLLLSIARRLYMGQETYGPFREVDPRNFRQEAHEEFLDATIYLARETIGKG